MRILLAIDGSAGASIPVDLVGSLRWPSDTLVDVVTVIDTSPPAPFVYPFMPDVTDYDASRTTVGHAIVEAAAERLHEVGLQTTTTVLHGRVADVLVERSIETTADLVVCGSRGHGRLRSSVFGSVARQVAERTSCPVLIARRGHANRVLLASDGSDPSLVAEQLVMRWPAFAGVPVDLVRVTDSSLGHLPLRRAALDGELRALHLTKGRLQASGRPAHEVLLVGDPAAQILGEASRSGADLIVIGTHDRTGIDRMWNGSVTDDVVTRSHGSVIIAR
jgi:nucleotide-binding universal stress UspA family protein